MSQLLRSEPVGGDLATSFSRSLRGTTRSYAVIETWEFVCVPLTVTPLVLLADHSQ